VAAVAAPAFDRTRASWRAARQAACATSTRTDAEAHRARALSCLADARDQLAALVDAAAMAPAARVRSADVAHLAPPISACQSSAPPTVPPPVDAAAAARRHASRRDLLSLMMSARAYDITPAEADAALERMQAAAAADDVVAAEIAARAGGLQLRRGDLERAADAFDAASVRADRGGHELVRAGAAIALYHVAVQRADDPEARRSLRERAAAALTRAGDLPDLAIELAYADIGADLLANRFDHAIELAEHNLVVERARGIVSAMGRASLLVAQLRFFRNTRARAYRRAPAAAHCRCPRSPPRPRARRGTRSCRPDPRRPRRRRSRRPAGCRDRSVRRPGRSAGRSRAA
jgi:hypothetical protein